MNLSKAKTIILAASVSTITISMILLPEESLNASIRGLNMWWEIVFPSLFPFFVLSDLLIGFGVVKFMGVLLEPFMRPLFRVPGVGGFAWAMGMASGFPAGAKLSARLRQEGQLTRVEAQRLVAFTNCSSPLFIFGAVAVGFFHNPRLGIMLAFAHYLGNFFVGLIMRNYGEIANRNHHKTSSRSIIPDALAALHQTRLENKKPFGKLIGDAVISSIHTLLMIGGFIILFSVLNKILFYLQITVFLASLIQWVLVIVQLPTELGIPLVAGIFEITLGNQMTSEVQEGSLMQQAIIASFILGFSGFSVQAQVASILAQTDLRFVPFLVARIMHGCIAGLLTFLFWSPFEQRFLLHDKQAINYLDQHEIWWETARIWISQFGPLFTIISLLLYITIYIRRMNGKSL